MFFLLSKILAFIISPINWIVFAVLIGLFAKRKQLKRRAYITAVVIFFVFSNGWLSQLGMRWLEIPTIAKHELKVTDEPYKAGILLGGMIHYQSDTNLVTFNSNGDRLFQTIDLYSHGVIEYIVITSGSGLMQLPSFREAYLIKKYLVGIGLPPEDIIIETKSRNTHENAVLTKEVLEARFGDISGMEFLLVTSASHMWRAKGCFNKQGMDVIPYSTTRRGYKAQVVFNSEMVLPDPLAFRHWKIITHELAGYLVYKLTGKV